MIADAEASMDLSTERLHTLEAVGVRGTVIEIAYAEIENRGRLCLLACHHVTV